MKKILSIILLGILIFSNAYAVSCDFISNKDIKHFCKAIKEKSETECNFINDNDIKFACLAEVSKHSSYCNFIFDNDLKYLCKVRSEL